MKKKTRKLKLDKQTLRKLEEENLEGVQGGTFIPDYGFSLGKNKCGS